MKKYNMFISACFISLFSFCKGENKKEAEKITDSTNLNHPEVSISKDTTDCSELFSHFFQSSDFESQVMEKNKLNVIVTQMEDSIALIKVFYRDTSTSEKLTIGWLELDLRGRSLKDISVDPDSPRLMNYDKEILNRLLNSCRLYE